MGIISDSIFFKHHIIKENIEDKKYKWLIRSYALKDSFWSEFFEFSIENSCADMYDLFESGRKNSLRRYIKSINETTGAKYYKMMAFIHLTDFVRKRDMGLTEKGYTSFKEIFKPDKTEKRFFDLLMRCFLEFNDEFIDLRNAVFLKYVFGITAESDNVLAFTGSFCYNSYNKFMDSFNRFVTVERRMEVAE